MKVLYTDHRVMDVAGHYVRVPLEICILILSFEMFFLIRAQETH